MEDSFLSRTELLLHQSGVERLGQAHVLVVGLGGVGGYAAEMLCRAGVGKLTLVDSDVVSASNINRQIIASHATVGLYKTDVFKHRFADINPTCQVRCVTTFLRDEAMVDLLESGNYDYVVDAIDTLSPKVFLLYHCHR
ncbi:MAG: ThiF family adenylyltransferase, partial [Bacteroidales bacterium]|nr:ThiF family adenylyltransferase [Candidatus Colimorpha onthohippi]